jgi:hypothetical protein
MNWMVKITQLDRRWIFLLVALAVIIPQLKPFKLPMEPTVPVRAVFDYIDSLPEGARIFIAMDYDPASEAELYPMTLAIMRHCFEKKQRVLAFTFWVTGKGLISRAFNRMEAEYHVVHGIDYANYGFQVGGAYVIIQAGQNFPAAYPMAKLQRTEDMQITQGVQKLGDLDYIIDLAAGATIDWWVAYGVERFKFILGAGVTAVSATQYYPYINTGQINGLIGGLKGAAEYEKLLDDKYGTAVGKRSLLGDGMKGMGSQSTVHALVIFLVVITNIFYFLTKGKA